MKWLGEKNGFFSDFRRLLRFLIGGDPAPAVENRLRFSTAGEGPFFLVLFLKEKGRIFSDSERSRGKYRKKGEFFPLPGPFSFRKRTGFPRTRVFFFSAPAGQRE